MKKLISILTLFIVLPSCSSTLSEARKASIGGVVVQPSTTDPKARKAVVGSKSPGTANSIPTVTGGGALPALLGHLIDGAVTSAQSSNFKKQYAQQLTVLEQQVPANLNKQMTETTIKVVASNAFFGPRLNKQPDHQFTMKVNSFGFTRVNRSKGETYLGAQIHCLVTFSDRAKGKKLFSQPIIAVSKSHYTPRQLSGNKRLSDQLLNEALRDYENKLKEYLNKVTK